MSIDYISDSEYMFFRNRYSALTTWSNQPFSDPGSRGKSHIEHVVSDVTGFFFYPFCFFGTVSVLWFCWTMPLGHQ